MLSPELHVLAALSMVGFHISALPGSSPFENALKQIRTAHPNISTSEARVAAVGFAQAAAVYNLRLNDFEKSASSGKLHAKKLVGDYFNN